MFFLYSRLAICVNRIDMTIHDLHDFILVNPVLSCFPVFAISYLFTLGWRGLLQDLFV